MSLRSLCLSNQILVPLNRKDRIGQPGVELVGLLPPELQDLPSFVFSAGVLAAAREPQAAKALIQFLSGPAAASVLKAKGMDPERDKLRIREINENVYEHERNQ